jgi:hypothetical protein
MKYLERWLVNLERPFDNSVKKDSAGCTIYYPWSYWGKGRVIKDQSTENQMRYTVRIYNFVWMILGLTFLIIIPNRTQILIWAIPAMWALFQFASNRVLADCPVSAEKLTYREYNLAVAKHFNAAALFLLLLLALGGTGLSLFALSAQTAPAAIHGKVACIFGVLFFGLASANLAYIFSLKE